LVHPVVSEFLLINVDKFLLINVDNDNLSVRCFQRVQVVSKTHNNNFSMLRVNIIKRSAAFCNGQSNYRPIIKRSAINRLSSNHQHH